MNKYLPIIIIAGVIVLGGMYLLSNSQRGSNPEHNGHKTEDQPIVQSHRSYDIEITQKPQANHITLNKATTIKYKIKNDKGELVKDFAIAHEKLMHFIIIRKDLTQFRHLHPDFNKETGEFSVDIVFTVDGPYRFFADFTPGQENFQKLPVVVHSDINVGAISKFQPHAATPDEKKKMAVPPDYMVTYTFPNELKSLTPIFYSLLVEKDNQPVTLENYLGARGHSVILKEGTLDYIHAHADEQNAMSGQMNHSQPAMDSTQQTNKIDFTTTLPEKGIYRIFTQFQHEGNVYKTEYTVEVK